MTETLRWAHLTPDDVVAWSELTTVLADADGTGESYAAEDLAEELAETGVTPETDTWAVWDDDDLVATGSSAWASPATRRDGRGAISVAASTPDGAGVASAPR